MRGVHVGDKFIIEIDHTYWHPQQGNRYFAKGFKSLVFDDEGISRLKPYKEPPKERPHTCEFCEYMDRGGYEMPCVVCDKNDFSRKDMFKDKGI